jgi:hypothetical protein
MIQTHTPGSDEAVKDGCTCPVIDNGRGRGVPGPDGPHFWISWDCPIHCPVHQGVEPLEDTA